MDKTDKLTELKAKAFDFIVESIAKGYAVNYVVECAKQKIDKVAAELEATK